jgi:predicted phosphodiesterase
MNKVKVYAVLADIHYPKYHKPTLNAILDYLEQNKVDGLVYQGDQLDMENISHHTKGKPGLRSKRGYLNDVHGFEKDVLLPIESKLKQSCEKYWIIGNHERFEQDLVEDQPELEALVDHKRILKLEDRGYKVIPLGHSLKLGKLIVCHGEILSGLGNQMGVFPARKAVQLYAGNVLAAHSHAPQMFTQISPVEHTQKWQGYINGIIGSVNPSYLRNRPTAWLNGFSIVEVQPDGMFNLYLINIFKGCFSFGGRIYGKKV